MIFILIIVGVALVALFLLYRLFKIPKLGCLAMVTGGVKCGKSMMSVWFAVRNYKAQYRRWKVRCFFIRAVNAMFRKEFKQPEEPLLYSNVKLAGVKYTLLTVDMILRKVRPAYKSVVYIQEASLLADSMYFKNMTDNERLLLFNKLYGHETHGGYLIYDTQTISDNHYAVRRCLSTYFWIHHLTKVPFFCVLYVREMFFSEDNSAVNSVEDDVEIGLRRVLIPKFVWKMYDAYCYSAFTDDLPVLRDDVFEPRPKRLGSRADLKTRKLVTLKKFVSIGEYNNNDKDK